VLEPLSALSVLGTIELQDYGEVVVPDGADGDDGGVLLGSAGVAAGSEGPGVVVEGTGVEEEGGTVGVVVLGVGWVIVPELEEVLLIEYEVGTWTSAAVKT
jgi:hypothetical protein